MGRFVRRTGLLGLSSDFHLSSGYSLLLLSSNKALFVSTAIDF